MKKFYLNNVQPLFVFLFFHKIAHIWTKVAKNPSVSVIITSDTNNGNWHLEQ